MPKSIARTPFDTTPQTVDLPNPREMPKHEAMQSIVQTAKPIHEAQPFKMLDYPVKEMENASRWNSMSPDRLAKARAQEYKSEMANIYTNLQKHVTTPEQQQVLDLEMAKYNVSICGTKGKLLPNGQE